MTKENFPLSNYFHCLNVCSYPESHSTKDVYALTIPSDSVSGSGSVTIGIHCDAGVMLGNGGGIDFQASLLTSIGL